MGSNPTAARTVLNVTFAKPGRPQSRAELRFVEGVLQRSFRLFYRKELLLSSPEEAIVGNEAKVQMTCICGRIYIID